MKRLRRLHCGILAEQLRDAMYYSYSLDNNASKYYN
jgi:hypothetical protein